MPDTPVMEPVNASTSAPSSNTPNVAAGVMSLGGSITSGIGNRRALKYAQRNFNTAMEFNRYMADTQWQRAVKDMLAAGLNPMLAYGQGGNSAAAVGQPPVVNEGAGVAEGIYSAVSAFSNARLAQAQARKLNVEADILEPQAGWSASNAEINHRMLAAGYDQLALEIEKLGIDKDISQMDLSQLKPLVLEFQRLQNRAAEYGMPAKKAEADFYNKIPEGKWAQIVGEILKGSSILFRGK